MKYFILGLLCLMVCGCGVKKPNFTLRWEREQLYGGDRFEVVVDETGHKPFRMNSGAFDAALRLTDSAGHVLAFNDNHEGVPDEEPTSNAEIGLTLLQGQTYYLYPLSQNGRNGRYVLLFNPGTHLSWMPVEPGP